MRTPHSPELGEEPRARLKGDDGYCEPGVIAACHFLALYTVLQDTQCNFFKHISFLPTIWFCD